MNAIVRRLFLFTLLALPLCANAQNISVASFKMLDNDLTANTYGTMELDQNGEVAALIKVVTTEQGFVFDGGMVGIVKTKQGVGEVWVYVPHGIKRITIQHPQLGVLRDYYFPTSIEKARTYEMVLTTGRVETVVTHAVNKQFVVFSVQPTNAIVELGDEVLTVDGEGYAMKRVPYGTYSYRVSCANYTTEAGQVVVTAQGKAEVNVSLRPNFGWLAVNGAKECHGAHVYVDNERVGQLPLEGYAVSNGVHRVKVVKSHYKTYEQQIAVANNETTALEVQLVPNFATVTLKADADCEIWVDEEFKGKGQWSGPLELGDYTVEVKKESHRTVSDILRVQNVGTQTMQLKSPKPIYASLEVTSTPLRATVYVDGKEVGETPLVLTDVLTGTRRVTFKKAGYESVDKEVSVIENADNSVTAELRHDKAAASTPVATKPVASQPTKKEKQELEWGFGAGLGAGHSATYGLNYGGELGLSLGKLTLNLGARSYAVGHYTVCDNDMAGSNAVNRDVCLLHFVTKAGYTFGSSFRFTPQVGLVFGPSVWKGREYVVGNLPAWDGVTPHTDKVLADRDYIELNSRIEQFARLRGIVAGARIEYRFGFGLGIHLTPEYVVGDGLAVGAGLSLNF